MSGYVSLSEFRQCECAGEASKTDTQSYPTCGYWSFPEYCQLGAHTREKSDSPGATHMDLMPKVFFILSCDGVAIQEHSIFVLSLHDMIMRRAENLHWYVDMWSSSIPHTSKPYMQNRMMQRRRVGLDVGSYLGNSDLGRAIRMDVGYSFKKNTRIHKTHNLLF